MDFSCASVFQNERIFTHVFCERNEHIIHFPEDCFKHSFSAKLQNVYIYKSPGYETFYYFQVTERSNGSVKV